MQVFVTGATGFVGTNVTKDLLSHGYTVLGLARSDESADKLESLGARVVRGSLTDLDILEKAAMESDAVFHLAFVHDIVTLEDFLQSASVDRKACEALIKGLGKSEKVFIYTGGTGGLAKNLAQNPAIQARIDTCDYVLSQSNYGLKSAAILLPPTTHGDDDHGFTPGLIGIAKKKGVSKYIGDGSNVWPSVHVKDAAMLYRIILERGEPGTQYLAVTDEGIPTKTIAAKIAAKLNVPLESCDPAQAMAHFGFLGMPFGWDNPSSGKLAREIGWKPMNSLLLDDLENGKYFDEDAFSKYA